jgi:hypothetical protein
VGGVLKRCWVLFCGNIFEGSGISFINSFVLRLRLGHM